VGVGVAIGGGGIGVAAGVAVGCGVGGASCAFVEFDAPSSKMPNNNPTAGHKCFESILKLIVICVAPSQ